MNILRTFAGTIAEQTGEAVEGAGTGSTAAGAIGVVLNSVYVVVGIVAVIFLILGGISYSTSQGDAGKIAKAKNTLIYSIVGLIIVVIAFFVTSFVLNQLG